MERDSIKPNYYAVIPANVRYAKDLSPNAKLLYGEITALSNAEGFCWASNAYFADLYDVSNRSIQGWLSQLEQMGFIRVEVVRGTETKRKIYIATGHEENFTPPRKKIHAGHEENFTPPHEENFTHNNTSINNTINNTSNKRLNTSASSAQIEREFEQLWKLYPRKIGKKKAFDSFKKARKIKKIPYETIENGLYRYIRYLEAQGTDEQFIQHGSTWFNQEKWQDEYIATATMRKAKNPLDLYNMEFGGIDNEHGGNAQVINNYAFGLPE
jgi:DNA-binding PadR family transcriptional regulator